jgi:molecular chaperone HscB
MLECRNCGAGAPLDRHFCPQCSRILALGRHGDYFSFLGLPRRLGLDAAMLERKFRELSRQFHPDYFYNAPPAERLASLERSSYLNDAYRTLRNPASRVEHLLAIEGLPPAKSDEGSVKVPPSLLEEVFALNEELDEIRELRESGGDAGRLRARLEAAKRPIEAKRDEHERDLQRLSAEWDSKEAASSTERRRTLDALRERLLERNYINNLLASIEREAQAIR